MNISLLGGWLPWTLRVLTLVLLAAAVGLRNRRWYVTVLPILLATGAAVALIAVFLVRRYVDAGDPLPTSLWFWLGCVPIAIGAGITGWQQGRWWRRAAAPLALLLALLTAGDALNMGLGYYPTVADMYGELTNQNLPAQVTLKQLRSIHGDTKTGRIVAVNIPAVPSGFEHRTEYVYLPPAWFRSTHRPKLPVVEMVAGAYEVPDNWIRSGNAVKTADAFAATHHGYAPILVFVDATSGFSTDTECVNGSAGNAGDHLTKDIPRYIEHTFGSYTDAKHWGVAGWSMGGTCAVTLAVTHPEIFGHFVDMAGDQGPNLGDKATTIAKLYHGNTAAWAANDPMTVLAHHGPYPHNTTGYFAVGNQETAHEAQAKQLSAAAKKDGIGTRVVVSPGKHSWTFAVAAFAQSLPWLAWQVGTPGVHKV
ncbi:alpha/beta hydrolase [Catenulispora pinisilvae]|uniref:alpha/beta hydrolase n=1 Tax=Catenulispora pinisilvae TaxID=2705253 RepID=UPI001890FBFC|nr:alpha/beta hydrolase-fold protein [Catenulispora pinisilvae]